MLTIVTTPRPLTGKFRLDLRNAVGSWKCLHPRPQILIFGGNQHFVESLGVTYVGKFPQSKQGLPFLDAYVKAAQDLAEFDVMMLTSDHLILLSDFASSLKKVSHQFPGAFAMIGQRWDADVIKPVDFRDPGWEREITLLSGRYRGHAAKDWFAFRLPLNFKLLHFVIGRRGWDTWFAHALMTSSMPVVDVTCAATTIHPTHEYQHVKGGVLREDSTDPGTLHNLKVYPGIVPPPKHTSDAQWGLTPNGKLLRGHDWLQWKTAKEKEWEAEYERRHKKKWEPPRFEPLTRLRRPHYCGWCEWRPK